MGDDDAPPAAAVIFDLGGVVLNSPLAAIEAYEQRIGLERHTINAVIGRAGEEGAFARLERGELTIEQFPEPFALDCARIGAPSIDGSAFMSLILDSCTPRPLMLEALGVLREGDYKTAALTNNFRSRASGDRFSSALTELTPLFDVIVQSAEEGMRKPEPKIYELACKRLGVEPAACIFLDDIGRNLKPAKALGMRTIRVETGDSTGARALKALAEMLGVGVRTRLLERCLRMAK